MHPLASISTETRTGPKGLLYSSYRLGVLYPGTAHKDGGVFQLVSTPGKHGAINQILHILRGHTPIGEDMVDAGIIGNNPIKDAGHRVCVQLQEELFHALTPFPYYLHSLLSGKGNTGPRSPGPGARYSPGPKEP